jgi:hypothetical protein
VPGKRCVKPVRRMVSHGDAASWAVLQRGRAERQACPEWLIESFPRELRIGRELPSAGNAPQGVERLHDRPSVNKLRQLGRLLL